jgi:nucleoside-diphosphate-sugar epimerase
MKIAILGCGWLGYKLATFFKQKEGVSLLTSNTNRAKVEALQQEGFEAYILQLPSSLTLELKEGIASANVVVISIPISKKKDILTQTAIFQSVIALLGTNPTQQLFFFSSVGIYPENENSSITELSIPFEDLNSSIAIIENLLRYHLPNINILRLGGLMGDDRYFSKYFQQKNIPNAHHTVNHLHYVDVCHVIDKMIDKKIQSKIYNVVAPLHPSKQVVFDYQTQGIVQNKYPRIERIVSSEKLISELNYQFVHPDPKKFRKV